MRLHAAISAFVIVVLAGAVYGQEPSEQQKRRLHLPYIRAATDCYANTIALNRSALDLAREGRWYDALKATGEVCNSAASQMIVMHDQIYGPGTGTVFFQGPYLEDLPRAVSSRLKDAIAKRNAEAEQADAIRAARIAESKRTRDLLRDKMYECTDAELRKLVASSEAAEILATAALTLCSKEINALLDAAVELDRLQGSNDVNFREDVRNIVRRNVVTSAVQIRAAIAKPVVPMAEPVVAKEPASNADSTTAAMEKCLRIASGGREGQLIDQEKLIEGMIDLCRPEIENAARSAFLADTSKDLSDLRKKTAERALQTARRLVGAN